MAINTLTTPTMCCAPPLDIAQVRTALIDIIDETDWLKHGIDTLDEAMESGVGYPARRFILNAVRDQAIKVKAALKDLDGQEWKAR